MMESLDVFLQFKKSDMDAINWGGGEGYAYVVGEPVCSPSAQRQLQEIVYKTPNVAFTFTTMCEGTVASYLQLMLQYGSPKRLFWSLCQFIYWRFVPVFVLRL